MSAAIGDAIVLTDGDAERPVAGVPLLLRTILALQRAGVERLTLVGGAPAPRDPRIRCDLATATALVPAADERLRLVVDPGTVIDETLVRALVARARPGEVTEACGDGARVCVAPGPLVGAPAARRLADVAGTLRRAAGPPAAQTRALLCALENPRDGYLDRSIHRRLSRPLTVRLLPTPITPNAVTVAGIVLGIAGGLLLGVPGLAAAAAAVLLLVASSVLDCVDGELARLRFAESGLGHWLDVVGDTVVHGALLGGIALRLAHEGAGISGPMLALLGTGILGAFVTITLSENAEERRRRVPSWENRVLDGVLSPLSTRDWYVFPVTFAVLQRLDWLVPAAAVGAHVFWVVTAVLLRRALARAS